MNCVGWYTAFAFCAWDSGRLPTEAEWEYAAAGGAEQRPFPWGTDAPNPSYASYGDATTQPPPVGSSPAGVGKYGQYDMAGSLWEQVLDSYSTYTTDPCVDCAKLGGPDRITRGGGWGGTSDFLRVAVRYHAVVAFDIGPNNNNGFRCARSAPR